MLNPAEGDRNGRINPVKRGPEGSQEEDIAMSWTHERIEYTNVSKVGMNFLRFTKRFQELRPDKPCCELCSENFKEDDQMHIAFTDHGNKLICDGCMDEAAENGAHITLPQKAEVTHEQ